MMSKRAFQLAPKSSQVHLERAAVDRSDDVMRIEAALTLAPEDPGLWIQLGQALRGQMLIREAVEAYSQGLSYHPFHALLYRHRAHALVNIRRYPEAAADFELSLRIDPTNWDCWYHLGLAYFLQAKYERALAAYERCIEITTELSKLSAVTDWYYMTLNRLGRHDEAEAALARIPDNAPPEEDVEYYNRLMVYKGIYDAGEMLARAETLDDHMYATLSYGIARFLLARGDAQRARNILITIANRDKTWGGFAEQAAYWDLVRGDC